MMINLIIHIKVLIFFLKSSFGGKMEVWVSSACGVIVQIVLATNDREDPRALLWQL